MCFRHTFLALIFPYVETDGPKVIFTIKRKMCCGNAVVNLCSLPLFFLSRNILEIGKSPRYLSQLLRKSAFPRKLENWVS